MKHMKKMMYAVLILFVAVTMTACGGGGDDVGFSSVPGVSSIGVITGLGSVIVNGTTFSTTGAAVTMDDNPSAADQLKVGMVVKVVGTADDATGTGTATAIEARDALEGTISATGANTLTVMGQTVQIEDNVTNLNDDNTAKTFAAGAFAVGQTVEVHAFPDDQGGLRATRVVKKATGEFEMKGFVTAVTGATFGLSLTPTGASAMTVNFTGTLPAGVAAGSFVQVKSAAAPAGGAVTASSIKLEDTIGAAGAKAKVEGVVTSGAVTDFVVNGQKVITNAATLFQGGLKADFALGVKVEAEGPLDANRAIVATKISFRGNIRIEADVTASSPTSLTVIGKQVGINQYTRIDNGTLPIPVGSHVEVRAFADRDGNPIAARIIVRNADARVFLQAPVTAVGAGTMTIMGTAVNTNAATQFRVSTDAAETAVASSAFFAQVKPNVTVVKVRWASAAAFTAAGAVEQAEIQLGK